MLKDVLGSILNYNWW